MSDGHVLYQEAIKRAAAAATGGGELDRADGEARLDNPLCGDRVRVQVILDSGRIAAIAHQTRGCLLCRAGASLLGARSIGMDRAEVDILVAALARILVDQDVAPDTWPELTMFAPAHAHPSRHKCAMLPFKALQAALVAAEETK